MKKRILVLMAVIAAAGVMLAGCGSAKKEPEKKLDTKTAVATLEQDGKVVDVISEEYAWLYTLLYKDQYSSFFGDDFWSEKDENGNTYGELFKEDMIHEMKRTKYMVMEAAKEGIVLSDEEKDIMSQNVQDIYSHIEEDTLEKTGITEETVMEYEEDYQIFQKYSMHLMEQQDVSIKEEDVRQSDLFVLRFDTTDYDDDGNEVPYSDEKKAEQKKKAEKAYAMLEDGMKIEDVAKEFGIHPADCEMVMGRTPEAQRDEYYDEAFENAAFSLKEGEYSKVTEGRDAYFIVEMRVENNEEETAIAMEQAEAAAQHDLLIPIMEKIEEEYDMTINEENWDKISLMANISFKKQDVPEGEENGSGDGENTVTEDAEEIEAE